CENNHYAISVPLEKQLACEKVSDRAIGYGMPGITIDGQDPLEVYRVVKEAVERGRNGQGPTLIEAVTHRFTAHSSDDNDKSYRPEEELKNIRTNDPIPLFKDYLIENDLLNEEIEKEINDRVMKEVNEATEYAEKAPYASPEDTLKFVYAPEQ